MTVSAGIRLPLSSRVSVPPSCRSTLATDSRNRNVTARSRSWYFSASMISRSQNSSIRSRRSTTVTLVPSAANIEAYSMPITPAPTTTIDGGTWSMSRIWSESTTVRPSKSTVDGRAGLVPAAMMNFSAVYLALVAVRRRRTTIELGPLNRAVPTSMCTWLRASWLRMTSISRPITCWVREVRSETVISSLSRYDWP